MKLIPWWSTSINDDDRHKLIEAMATNSFSMGNCTKKLEEVLAEKFNLPYVVVTNSGSSALIMSLLACGVKQGDEVIVPAVTWIATAQAAACLGAKVILVDCENDQTTIDVNQVEESITNKTKAIIPVHLNGRACNMERLKNLVEDKDIFLIEDTCKGMFSKDNEKYLGSFGDVGCFSMGMISLISIGYGGFITPSTFELYEDLCYIRDHGVHRQPEAYKHLGFNFKISDLLTSLGINQIKRIDEKINHVNEVYKRYNEGLDELLKVKVLPVDIGGGKVPIYTEVYCEERESLTNYLMKNNIQISNFHLSINNANYLESKGFFPNAERFTRNSFIVPSGPSMPIESVDKVIKIIMQWENRHKSHN